MIRMVAPDSDIPTLGACAVACAFDREKGGSRGKSESKSGTYF